MQWPFIRKYMVYAIALGALFAVAEYYIRKWTGDDPQLFVPLIIRAVAAAILISLLAALFEIFFKERFRKRTFAYLVLGRSVFYALAISASLAIVNGFWHMYEQGLGFWAGVVDYIDDPSYPVNLITIFGALLLVLAIFQTHSLHRKGELWKFITGRYHRPQEVERLFCFVDLKGSTTIGEKLGHLRYGYFLQDYYSDITDAIRSTDAEIYQYVGDEIILSWSLQDGRKNHNALRCFPMMKEIINELAQKYDEKYGFRPEFRGGLHGGTVVVTWVGEVRKEIVYAGDVLNTAARIQEECKRLGKDFLVSGAALTYLRASNGFDAVLEKEMIPRGKEEKVKIYSLSHPVS